MTLTLESLERSPETRLLGGCAYRSTSLTPSPTVSVHSVNLPLCGFSYRAFDEGLIVDTRKAFHLARMGGEQKASIRQLQSLTTIHLTNRTPYVRGPHIFPQNRWNHSLGHAGFMDILCLHLGLDPAFIKMAIVLGCTHDGRTPAFGDATKTFFRNYVRNASSLVDEDAQYGTYFSQYAVAWHQLCETYGMDPNISQMLTPAVDGKGLLGQMHKLADASCYLTLDFIHLRAGLERLWGASWDRHVPGQYDDIFELAAGIPCTLWETTSIINGTFVFNDPKRLARFLRFHVAMWCFYMNPAQKYIENLYTHVLAPALFENGRFNPGILLRWSDKDVERIIRDEMGYPDLMNDVNALHEPPCMIIYRDKAAALAEEIRLADEGAFTLLHHTINQPKINTKTHLFHVRSSDGRVVTFEEAFPSDADELRRIAHRLQREPEWILYVVPKTLFAPNITPNLHAAWQKARKRWHAE